MKPPRPEQFDEYFRALNGNREPFPWQRRLARRVAEGVWPGGIALPTASGKTACIDIALFALACQANDKDWPLEKRTAPRRIFFVVDRRVVVDEAYLHAQKIADTLKTVKSGILLDVADCLRHLSGGEDPLTAYQMRGGIFRDDGWARSPVQPTVVVSTVDQVGSRLLFRPYGRVSDKMAPIHAGLVGNDSLIILDEAHCARPFMQTLAAVERYRGRQWAEQPLPNPFQGVVMSATLPPGITDIERAADDDLNHAVLGKRLKASKPAELRVAGKAKGVKALEHLADELAAHARRLEQGGARRIAVMVNRVATARMVYELLKNPETNDAVLMTGRMRPIDRDELVREWQPKLAASDGRTSVERTVFVVATQCLEVGANLDFDAIVTECASLDALRQRFGRLNRLGKLDFSPGVIVIQAAQSEDSSEDPVYGSSLAKTWAWLRGHAEGDLIDMGVASLDRFVKANSESNPEALEGLHAPSPDAPVMLPAHVDFWVQTSPTPLPDPDPAIFLHGPDRSSPEVQVCWRADLANQNADERDMWVQTVSLCPPSSAECMPVSLRAAKSWLQGEDKSGDSLSDVEGTPESDEEQGGGMVTRSVLRWRGREDSKLVTDAKDIRPGDTLVIPTSLGGWDVFGHIPPSNDGKVRTDLADQAFQRSRGQAILRLHPDVMREWPAGETVDRLRELATAQEALESTDEVRRLLSELAAETEKPQWLREAAEHLARNGREMKVIPHPSGGLVVRRTRLLPSAEPDASEFEGGEVGSSATVEVTLENHNQGVRDKANEYAERCGLPPEFVRDLTFAASVHDLGKIDPRFQKVLQGGSQSLSKEPLAKSGGVPLTRNRFHEVRQSSGLPVGFRHELLTIRLVESATHLLSPTHTSDPELVRYLLASHHGYCRPLAPVIDDPDARANPRNIPIRHNGDTLTAALVTGLEHLNSGLPEQFWILVRRYGWWGLAWLEAILRLADHRCSEDEQKPAEQVKLRVKQ